MIVTLTKLGVNYWNKTVSYRQNVTDLTTLFNAGWSLDNGMINVTMSNSGGLSKAMPPDYLLEVIDEDELERYQLENS